MDKYDAMIMGTRIEAGLKIYACEERTCIELEKSLNKEGIKTRVGCNELGMWSVYVVSTPCDVVEW